MSLNKLIAIALGLVLVTPELADARKKKQADDEEESADEDSEESDEKPAKKSKDADEEESSSDDEDDETTGSTTSEDEEDEEETPKQKKKKDEDAPDEEGEPKEFVKQNLSGHDLGTNKKANEFEKDRFFVDKVDTEKTEKSTLIQGSLTSTSFLYTESGGPYAGTEQGENAARFSRMFTELRLQTDFRHISAGRWDARIDARARIINQPEQATANSTSPTGGTFSADANHVQSGFNGTNEYDLRELWLFRSGKRSDIFLGRQFVPDLGGVKFDGLRIDYAKSTTMTLIGFGGLYPLRGSRSITTDYTELKVKAGNGSYEPAGRFVGAGGFGGAYRTVNTYGAFGGVVLYPLAGEQPRVFATSTGYYRYGSLLDLYHFALVDLYGSQIDTVGLTNLSAGANFKPSPRLRITGAVNRVDVDTLAVQANAFLNDPSVGGTNVENETYFRRLATNTGRVGVSAGLGEFNRFEVSINATYRARKAITIPRADPAMEDVRLQGTKGVEVGGSIVDRRSIKDLRLGIDVTRTIGIGGANTIAFMRSNIFATRVFAGRELQNGHGEWEADITYSTTQDAAASTECAPGAQSVVACYGSSQGSIISAGGTLYYRINRDWMAIGTLYVTRQTLTYYGNDAAAMGGPKEDPAVLGLTGFGRISYRF